MSKFLKSSIVFSMLLIVYFGANFGVNSSIIERTKPNVTTHILVAGASDVNSGVDPTILGKAKNISQLGEPLYVTYWKLKNLLAYNLVDTLIIGLSPIHFSAAQDKLLSKEMPSWASNWFRKTYPIADFTNLKDIEIDKWSFLKLKFKSMCLYPKFTHHHYIGRFTPRNLVNSNVTMYEGLLSDNFFEEGQALGISRVAKKYLEAIIQLCKEKNIKLILLGMPLHKDFINQIPIEHFTYFEKIKLELENDKVKFFDYRDLAIMDNEFFDACHLNDKGAVRFSHILKKDLQKK